MSSGIYNNKSTKVIRKNLPKMGELVKVLSIKELPPEKTISVLGAIKEAAQNVIDATDELISLEQERTNA